MRIIGGEWGGQPLASPQGSGTRPTSDAQREALFNILSHSIGHEPVRVLDLFAGTGALSFESFSRGALTSVLVESDAAAIKVIDKNTERFRLDRSKVSVITESRVERWAGLLARLPDGFRPFDTIFCDPPYRKGLALRAFRSLAIRPELFTPEALWINECAEGETAPSAQGWTLVKERSRGATQLFFYRRDP